MVQDVAWATGRAVGAPDWGVVMLAVPAGFGAVALALLLLLLLRRRRGPSAPALQGIPSFTAGPGTGPVPAVRTLRAAHPDDGWPEDDWSDEEDLWDDEPVHAPGADRPADDRYADPYDGRDHVALGTMPAPSGPTTGGSAGKAPRAMDVLPHQRLIGRRLGRSRDAADVPAPAELPRVPRHPGFFDHGPEDDLRDDEPTRPLPRIGPQDAPARRIPDTRHPHDDQHPHDDGRRGPGVPSAGSLGAPAQITPVPESTPTPECPTPRPDVPPGVLRPAGRSPFVRPPADRPDAEREPRTDPGQPAAPGPAGPRAGPAVAPPLPLAPAGTFPGETAGRHEARVAPHGGRHAPSPAQRKQLRSASHRLEGLGDRVEIARAAAEEAVQLVHADSAALVVRSVEGPRVLWQQPGGPDPVDSWGPATLGALLAVGVPVREVLEGDPLAAGAATSVLMVPVSSAGMLAGAILARRLSDRSFSPAEEDALARLARMTGAALDVAVRRGRPAEAANDPVTGFAPRDRLLGDLRSSLRAVKQHRMPVVLMVLEVSGLGSRRTERGRAAADQALAAIATVLARRLRIGDVAYRFGHDEIAVLLPLTDPASAAAVAERMTALPLRPDPDEAGPHADRLADPNGSLRLRVAWVPVEGQAEDVVLAAVRALASVVRAASPAEHGGAGSRSHPIPVPKPSRPSDRKPDPTSGRRSGVTPAPGPARTPGPDSTTPPDPGTSRARNRPKRPEGVV